MIRHAIRELVITDEQPYTWVLQRKCVMCGGELSSLADTVLAVHETAMEDVSRGVAFHMGSCAESFQVCDTGVDGPFDAECYVLHIFIPECEFKSREAKFDLIDVRGRVWFQLSEFCPELAMDAALLRDGRNRVALAIYDDAGIVLVEPIARDTKNPLHLALLKHFGEI